MAMFQPCFSHVLAAETWLKHNQNVAEKLLKIAELLLTLAPGASLFGCRFTFKNN